MARKIGKIGKKITLEIERVFNSYLQEKMTKNVGYIPYGGGTWTRTAKFESNKKAP